VTVLSAAVTTRYFPGIHVLCDAMMVIGEEIMGRIVRIDDLLPEVAERFRALAEPARLQLLRVLMRGEHTVTQLVSETGLGQANVSKHLQLLHQQGFVRRRKVGLFVHYTLTDHQAMEWCDAICEQLRRADAGERPEVRG
jgi:DNA-binding transcriptional ArsR family regulator